MSNDEQYRALVYDQRRNASSSVSGVNGIVSGSNSNSNSDNYDPKTEGATTKDDAASSSSSTTTSSSSSSSSSNPATINFRTLTGQLLSISVGSLAGLTVADIKREVEHQHGIPASFQRFIFSGRELSDTSFASECDIGDGVCIHLLLRQNPPPAGAAGAAGAAASAAAGGVGVGGAGAAAPLGAGAGAAGPFAAGGFPGAFVVMGEHGQQVAVGLPVGPPPPPMGADQMERISRLFQLARAVKMFAIIDGIFLVLWSFQFWPLVLGVALALCGYYGAKLFKPYLVAVYLVYIVLSIGVRVWWIVGPPPPSTLWIFLLVIGIIIELYISTIAIRFMKLAKGLTEAERAELLAIQNPARQVFF